MPEWRSPTPANASSAAPEPESADLPTTEEALDDVKASIQALLDAENVPDPVRRELAPEYDSLEAMLDKLEHGHIHIAVFGRVSVGKSSVLNALLGEDRFDTSPLHGVTRQVEAGAWQTSSDGHVLLYDTPGINEIDGETRERLATEVASRSDLVLFVVDSDLTDTELRALQRIAREHRPVLLVLNKADHYTRDERSTLLERLAEHAAGLVPADNVLWCSAAPSERIYVEVDDTGMEREVRRRPDPDVTALRMRLWEILDREGKTLAALNAGLFAGRLSDQVAARIIETKRTLAQGVINKYCLAKGLAVAFNPVPVTDLLAAAALDVAMILHLSRVYGLPVTRREAGGLVRVVSAQMAAIMGTVWAVQLVSSLLKLGSGGVSTVLTAATQGSVAYYATLLIGRAAEAYFHHGKSWGEEGPKRIVEGIINSVDRSSVINQARKDIRGWLTRS